MTHLLGSPAPHITLLGCGSSLYAAWTCKHLFEQTAPVSLELACEFHCRRPPMTPGVTIALSQSGETADTLLAVEYAKTRGQTLVAVVNTPASSLGRMADFVVDIQAGPEIGVASTKAFLAQMLALYGLAGAPHRPLAPLAGLLTRALERLASPIQKLAQKLAPCSSVLFLGRGYTYPLALEGALKMKEIAYIHAEGLPAGELKHGPIALIDPQLPVIVLAPQDEHFEKTLANMHEISARSGRLIAITDPQGQPEIAKISGVEDILVIPEGPSQTKPFLMTLPLQLVAYFTALARGCTIDKPRNLAKSVTVE